MRRSTFPASLNIETSAWWWIETIGNTAGDNSELAIKACIECGSVMTYDKRPLLAYERVGTFQTVVGASSTKSFAENELVAHPGYPPLLKALI